MTFRQRYLNLIFEESKQLFPNTEKACVKAAEQEKSIYDRAKTKSIYSNLAANLIKSLRQQNQKTSSTITTTTTIASKYNLKTKTTPTTEQIVKNKSNFKLVNNPKADLKAPQPQRIAYSHEAILAGPKASKVSYSINRKKTLTLKELTSKLHSFFF